MTRRPVTCGQADAMLWLAGGLADLSEARAQAAAAVSQRQP